MSTSQVVPPKVSQSKYVNVNSKYNYQDYSYCSSPDKRRRMVGNQQVLLKNDGPVKKYRQMSYYRNGQSTASQHHHSSINNSHSKHPAFKLDLQSGALKHSLQDNSHHFKVYKCEKGSSTARKKDRSKPMPEHSSIFNRTAGFRNSSNVSPMKNKVPAKYSNISNLNKSNLADKP